MLRESSTSQQGGLFGAVPDEVFVAVLQAYPARYQIRALAPRCRALVEDHFQLRHYVPPIGKMFTVDFEINKTMTKHLYCAKFFCEGSGVDGGVFGAVTFVNWIPVYYRSNPNSRRDIRYRLGESDACTLWRTLAKVREERASGAASPDKRGLGEEGHLTITEDCSSNTPDGPKRQVVGLLSPHETDMVLSVLDHRRNASAEVIPHAEVVCA